MGRLLWGLCFANIPEYLLPIQWNVIIGFDFQDINYGVMFSRKFIDSQENNETAAGLMNLHNNEAGRRVRIQMLTIFRYFIELSSQ